jgi:hypothetical protein
MRAPIWLRELRRKDALIREWGELQAVASDLGATSDQLEAGWLVSRPLTFWLPSPPPRGEGELKSDRSVNLVDG